MIPHLCGADNPPIVLPEPVLDDVPAELRERPQWLCWHYVIRDGKPRKVPVNPLTGWNASSTNPKHRGPFDIAVAAVRHYRLSGVGFVFTSNDPYVGIDLDNALEETAVDGKEPVLKGWAADFCRRLPSYAEISPSGKGVKIFARGVPPGKAGHKFAVADGAVEIYSAARYFTVTGARLPGFPAGVQDVGPELVKVLEELNRSRTPGKSADDRERVWDGEVWNTGLSPSEVVRIAGKAKNGSKFRMLYFDGDTRGYKSESEADLSLVSMIVFFTGPDPDLIEEVFSGSALALREKWQEREDYRDMTILKVLAQSNTFLYGPRYS